MFVHLFDGLKHGTGLFQLANQFRRLIGGDAAGNDQQHAFSVKHDLDVRELRKNSVDTLISHFPMEQVLISANAIIKMNF